MRYILILILFVLIGTCSSCSMAVNLTTQQRVALEQKKFNRFKTRPSSQRGATIVVFTGIALGLYVRQDILKNK